MTAKDNSSATQPALGCCGMKTILWDFDGTLAYREGGWSATLLEVLRSVCPESLATREDVRAFLATGFPWHTPLIPHTDIRSPDEWWLRLAPVLERAFAGVGAEKGRCHDLVQRLRARLCDSRYWRLYDDAIPTLTHLAARGWSHQVLSNHVPELVDLVRALGLARVVVSVHCSALTGYEKPHPEAFRGPLRALPQGAEVWMVGDNVEADVLGAEACGIPAILVRRPDPRATRCSESLRGIEELLSGA